VCEWTVTPLVNPQGDIVSVIAQGQDVTRQIEAERVKKEFTSTLSHELRTPLTRSSARCSWSIQAWPASCRET